MITGLSKTSDKTSQIRRGGGVQGESAKSSIIIGS